MQKFLVKISCFLGLLLMFHPVNASVGEKYLQHADSLFEAGKYTEAFEMYENLLKDHQHYSSKMLLRMAYIKEGLGEHTQSLYYLNLHYYFNANDRVLKKMSTIADEKGLEGYEFNDLEYFQSLFHRYYVPLLVGGLLLLAGFFGWIVYRRQKQQVALPHALIFTLLAALFFVIFNYADKTRKGIVKQDYALLMEAPSAGAPQISMINKGNRLEIVGREDIWYKVAWQDQEGYIRAHNLLLVP